MLSLLLIVLQATSTVTPTATLQPGQATVTALASATWEPTPNFEEWQATALAAQATGTHDARRIYQYDKELRVMSTRAAACHMPTATEAPESSTPEATSTAVPSATQTPSLTPSQTASVELPSATPTHTGTASPAAGASPPTGAPPSPSGYSHDTPTPRPLWTLYVPLSLTWRLHE